MQPDIDDYRWLTSPLAEPHVQQVANEAASPALVMRLRRQLTPARARLVVELAELRHRAQRKFSQAAKMFFTRQALEQATDETISAYKAARLAAGAACMNPADFRLAELCCGIGGDLLAMAGCGARDVLAVDADPVIALLAQANLAACELHGLATVQVGDAADVAVAAYSAWHIDPDRRAEGRRTTQLSSFAPSLEQLQTLLETNPQAAIKLAPATELPEEWLAGHEREWIGSQGECRQQMVWGGSLTRYAGRRTATVLAVSAQGGPPRTVVSPPEHEAQPPRAPAIEIGRYVFEPHAAVLAAQLDGMLAAEHDLRQLSPLAAYYTGDRPIHDLALAAFEVWEVLPFRVKTISAWLAERGMGRIEVKKRGVDIDPLPLQKQLKGKGDKAAVVIVAPCPLGVRAIVASRVASGE